MPVAGRDLSSRAAHDGGRDMRTGESLTASDGVQRLQTALHAKAKEAPGFRFYFLSDKVWRDDVLAVAWPAVQRNGGTAGVDGETVADIEALGVDRWLGALARDLKEGTYRPRAIRRVFIPKKQRGKFRPLGIPCLRDRVAQTAAMLVLSPIFEADLQPEQYAYRPGRDAHDAVRRVHRLLTTGASVAARTGRVASGRGPRKGLRSRRCSATSTCGASFWTGRCWATPGTSRRKSSTMRTTSRFSAARQQR